jgi:hypothetical protein
VDPSGLQPDATKGIQSGVTDQKELARQLAQSKARMADFPPEEVALMIQYYYAKSTNDDNKDTIMRLIGEANPNIDRPLREALRLLLIREPAQPADAMKAAALISQLDARRFQQRKTAYAELEKLLPRVRIEVREAAQRHPSLEVRRRCQDLLHQPIVGETLVGDVATPVTITELYILFVDGSFPPARAMRILEGVCPFGMEPDALAQFVQLNKRLRAP